MQFQPDSSAQKLVELKQIISCVYSPLQSKRTELKGAMLKFVGNLAQCLQQSYGNVTIEIPDLHDEPPEVLAKNSKLVGYLEGIIRQEKRVRDSNTAMGKIQFWRNRSATFSTLYQQISHPKVKKVIEVMENALRLNPDAFSIDNYKLHVNEFNKQHAIAKDYVKFLNTLDRQFKNIGSGDLVLIQETLTSLMNGLKLVWTISRHINQDGDEMEDLMLAISTQICEKVASQIDNKKVFMMLADEALSLIDKGIKCLEKVDKAYNDTRIEIEREGYASRWDFPQGKLFGRTRHMAKILLTLREACKAQHEFKVQLGHLKAVTGNSEDIDSIMEQVNAAVGQVRDFNQDLYNESFQDPWMQNFSNFDSAVTEVRKRIILLIDKTFKSELRSAEGGFDMLEKFKDTAFLHEDFKHAMEKNRTSILIIYEEELKQVRNLFEDGRNGPPISKNKPPIAGAISWARSLMHRIKTPIIKFKAHEQMLSKPQGQQVTLQYIKLAKQLDKYETDLFTQWAAKNVQTALSLLKRPILMKEGENKYKVNFTNELRMLIRESKYLDRMGFELSKTVLNIALQQKQYLQYIDKIRNMLSEYDEAVGNLKQVEKKLLKNRIQKLNKYLQPGTKPINWNSLGIDEFINNCLTQIGQFRATKSRVAKSAQMIQEVVQSVENAVLVRQYDWENYVKEKKPKTGYGLDLTQDAQDKIDEQQIREPKQLMQFIDYFDTHRQDVLKQLVGQYKRIGDQFLKNIQETTVGTDSMCAESMKQYYEYWQRRIFNALTTMIVRALATIKVLFSRREKRPPLFRIQAEYNQPDLNFIPSKDQVMSQLEKFSKNVLQAAKQFGRWKDGHCQLCKERTNPQTGEKYYNFTFFEDINKVKIVTELRYDIEHIRNQIGQKIGYVDSFWNKYYSRLKLFDTNEKNKLEKIIDKNPSTWVIETRILEMVKVRENINEHPHENQNIFMTIDTTEVINKGKEQIEEWLALLKKGLSNIANRQLNAVQKRITDYKKDLNQDPSTIESLKFLLRIITEIKDQNMNMEFSIAEIKEKFSILKTHFSVDPAISIIVESLDRQWSDLIFQAKKKDFELNDFKKNFAEVTQRQVEQFQKEIQIVYQEYRATGPNSQVPLDEGYASLKRSKAKIMEFNKQREEFVLAEKLFNLEISTYPLLIQMEESNKLLDQIYSVYDQHTNQVNEWSTLSWNKLDINALLKGASDFEVRVRRLAKEFESYHPFMKLRKVIEGFKESVPLIEKLKNPAIQDRHWKRIIEETGRTETVNLKTITLGQVFKLELQNYQEAVDAIVNEAIQEASNQAKIVKIEQAWKISQFQVAKYKKGNEERGWVLKAADEIKSMLEDDILTLQNIGGSPYAKAFIGRVRNWDKALNLISDVIDIWFVVQRKWMYLESIFASDDIRQQLPEGAKKFDKVDKNFKRIMEGASRNSNVYSCCHAENRLSDLHNISKELDKCQKSLSNYLESKRFSFPRFYFISDDQLLYILGNSDPTTIQTHMLKLFDNCKELTFTRRIITGMQSDEGEKFDFRTPVKPEGAVEDWMNKVDDEMKRTLHQITKQSTFHYAKSQRLNWITQQIGMVAIVGTQIWWTFAVQDVFKRVKDGDKHAMKVESARQTQDLNDLITKVRSDITSLERKMLNSLIILDVHARDIVDSFVRDSILDAREFEWEKQLRFYWFKKEDDIRARQCTGIFTYGYEYQGLNGRLVITPLTDRCVMTLTTALTFKLGGSPAGPAGTGKTETVKDLAKSLALRCVVNNCGEGLDYKAMGIIFSGLSQTGFWGCFDEFNRINPEVLSVVSAQIKTIQNSLLTGKGQVKLLDMDMRLIPTIGIFVTMNPGYAGRSELPENVKALFRPVTMVVPDLILICEIMLMSEGFTTARVLAKKMTVLYKLASQQLSKQYFYDFGLRALKSVLVMAGSLKRGYPQLSQDAVLMRALRDMNMPKFIFQDVPLFQGLINDLFPGLKAKRVGYEDLKDKIILELDGKGYKHSNDVLFENQVNKIIQLYETMLTRHTTMVVGPTGAGKTIVINTLKESLKAQTGIPTKIEILNPKAQTVPELYGVLDPITRDWTDGLLSKVFRQLNEDLPPDKPERRWILYDGDVDALWVENMNSVMDDNRILTLTNGERIRLQKHCSMLYEVFDLQYASPATISRCGMVFVDPKNLGYAPFFERWAKVKTKTHSEVMTESLMDLYRRFIPQCIDYVLEGVSGEDAPGPPLEFISPRTNLNMVTQFCSLFDALLPDENAPQEVDQIENMFIFCIIWSIGGALLNEERPKFDEFIRKIAGRILPSTSLYDNYFDQKTMNLFPWEKVVEEYQPPTDGKFSSILVPTVDTKRYSWLLSQVIKLKRPCMFIGHSGSAKSVTAFSYLKQLDNDKFIKLNINFSSRTTSMDVQKTIEENVDKRSARIYGPPAGRQLIIFVDDLNMPKIDIYGTQQPIALLKFLIEKSYLYQRGGDLERREIVDTQYVGAMSPPGGGNNAVDPRFMSLFSTFNITFPGKQSVEKIYNSILAKAIENFPEDVHELTSKITQATIKLYLTVLQKLPRTPVKFHYIFNLRDLSRVYEGLTLATVDKFESKDSIVKLWRNECIRVFSDRLSDVKDKQFLDELIPSLIGQFFPEQKQYALKDPLLYGDFALSDPSDPEAEDPRLYQDMDSFEAIGTKLNKMLEEYNYTHQEMDIVLFDDALDHLTRIHRMIRFPRGNALLIGVGGSGKQSLSRLATFTAGYQLFMIQMVKNYKEPDFREDLKNLYRKLLEGPQVFLFTDAFVLQEGFLELINNMLTIGMVPALFAEDEKDALFNGGIREQFRKTGGIETKENLWQYFVSKARDSLHVVLAMSPAGDTLKIRCRNFPGLVSSTSIDWFFPWPRGALEAVATHFLQHENFDEESHRQPVTDHIVMVHLSVGEYSQKFEQQLKRKTFVTPKFYLDFIRSYRKLLGQKRNESDQLVRRLEGGLLTLIKAAEDTKVLSEELAIKKKEIKEKKDIVQELIRDIREKTAIANEQQATAAEKKAFLDVESVKIQKEKGQADKMLEEAIPALQAAAEALKNLEKSDITEIRQFKEPPTWVKYVCQLTFFLKPTGREEGTHEWGNVLKTTLADPDLLGKLQHYKKENLREGQVKKARNTIAEMSKKAGGDDQVKVVIKNANKAANGLFTWVMAMLNWFDINRTVEPKRKKADEMEKKLKKAQEELAATEANLKQLSEKLADLNARRQVSEKELEQLTIISNKLEKRLTAATKLITGLASEQKRWSEDMEIFKNNKWCTVGDCLLGSAFLSYSGPFNHAFRKEMIYENWYNDIKQRELPHNDNLQVQKLLTTQVEISKWASQGLPGDELSIQNGILTTRANRWPLCIDPQMQGVLWIKQKERNNKLEILTFNQSDYMKKLEMSIQFGKPVLFEAIDEDIDPMMDPVLEKNYIVKAGQKFIKVTDSQIEWDDNFKLYFTSKLANPRYTPEIMGKTMIINYNVTLDGLKQQLLNEVVGHERPELEKQRKQLIIETSENKAKLKQEQDLLLSELSNNTGPLVDNEPLIETLESAKQKAEKIAQDLKIAGQTQIDIDTSCSNYVTVAKRGAILFFAMAGLSAISEMYEYSLSSYLEVFRKALSTSRKDNILQNRLRNIKEKLTMSVFDFTCMGIFERHKIMFSLQMTLMIMDGEKELNHIELDFFLKGNTSLEQASQRKPYKWINERGWKDIQKLVGLNESWSNFIMDLTSAEQPWKTWYDFERPEEEDLPMGYDKKLNSFQKMLLVRIFRPDRVYNATKLFIMGYLNEHYIQSHAMPYDQIFAQSHQKSPIVFILSPGADPLANVQKLAEQVFGAGSNKFRFLALGQGMENDAKSLIDGGVLKGHWVMLQNCHLLTSWLKKLEGIIEGLHKPDKNFRLWLTTEPTDKFPHGILQKSLKVVTQPPDGLKQNIRGSFARLTDQMLDSCDNMAFKPLVYVLAFFHAVVQERRKFGKIGWNVTYDFNEADFGISFELLAMYLTKALENGDQVLPWGSLNYLIGNAMYGGRVTDDFDRRVLVTYLSEYMGEFIFDKNQPFFFSKGDFNYKIYASATIETIQKSIQDLPRNASPEVFGLHSNAEIQYLTNNAKTMWVNLIEMQTSSASSGGGINRQDYIKQVADGIQGRIPQVFDEFNIKKMFENPKPTQIVLLQELQRYDKLLQQLHDSLFNLQRALKGQIGMSQDLDQLASSLFNGFLPPMWRRLAPQTEKGLASWMLHFERRYSQYKFWVEEEEPKVMWLSGLHIPESYLTALVQTTCRAKKWALDKSTLYTVVTKMKSPDEVEKRLEHGNYVQGLYLEGAKWDYDRGCLSLQNPKQLVVEMPLIQIVPVQVNKLKLRGMLKTPVYVTQARKSAMGTGLVFEADLKTEEHASHWILQGVCLVLNTD